MRNCGGSGFLHYVVNSPACFCKLRVEIYPELSAAVLLFVLFREENVRTLFSEELRMYALGKIFLITSFYAIIPETRA